jgi:hypothetical protein
MHGAETWEKLRTKLESDDDDDAADDDESSDAPIGIYCLIFYELTALLVIQYNGF